MPLSNPALHHLLRTPSSHPARGTASSRDVKRIVVTLDVATFDRVAMLAAASRVSFAEATRQLLVRGLNAGQAPRRRIAAQGQEG